MAIGARITSENLSGKTATVTFIPYTGSTSGSTVNLGTKTIPFNNINTHPYGVYNLYFAEYDYTYTLTVDEPVSNVKSWVYVSKMVNENSYGAAFLNFNDFTATIIDLNVDTNTWSNVDVKPLTNSGYGYHFNGDGCDQLVVFVDASGVEVGRYSGSTCDYNFSAVEGIWITFEDMDNGVFKYFNGENVYTYEYDQTRYSFDLQWEWDAVTSNKSFVGVKYDESQGTDNQAILFKLDGTRTTLKSWSSADFVAYNFYQQFNSDFFVVEEYNPGGYEELEIRGLDGTVLETISLSGETYNETRYGFQGTNKFFYITWDNGNSNIDYKIIHYNFDTETLIETSHERGTSFANFEYNSDSDFYPDESGNQNLLMTFSNWGEFSGSNNLGREVTYMDIMYIFGNQSSFTTFVFADDETKYCNVYFDQQGTNIFRTKCNNGDDIASVLTIMSGSTRVESLNIPVSGYTNSTNDWAIDNKTVYRWYGDSNYTGATYVLINATGGTQDQMTLEFSQAYGNNESNNQYKVFYLAHNTVANGYEGWYINDNTTGFTSTGYYNNQTNPDEYFKPDFLEDSTLLLHNSSTNVGRVLTATGISNQFSLPEWNDVFRREIGETMFAVLYDDFENDYYHIKLYDFDGTLLNTLDTTYMDYDDFYAVGDIFVARFYNDNTGDYDMYMISADNIEYVSLEGNYDTDESPSDYVWWDNW
jgi:hypothetical protein